MNRELKKKIGKKLSSKPTCYVLITCDAPSADGNMQVEMTYEGDATMAAYLLQGAQQFINAQEDVEIEVSDKVYPLSAIANH